MKLFLKFSLSMNFFEYWRKILLCVAAKKPEERSNEGYDCFSLSTQQASFFDGATVAIENKRASDYSG